MIVSHAAIWLAQQQALDPNTGRWKHTVAACIFKILRRQMLRRLQIALHPALHLSSETADGDEITYLLKLLQ